MNSRLKKNHAKPVVIACSGLLAILLSGCQGVLSWEEPTDVVALAKTWPKYQAPSYVDPSSPVAEVAVATASPEAQGNAQGEPHGFGPMPPPMSMSRTAPPTSPRKVIRPPVRSRDDWDISEIVADSLGRIGSAAVPKVVELLGDADPKVRVQAAKTLAKIGPDARAAVEDLTELLKDENEEVRKAAARALGQIGPAAENSVEALLEMLVK